MLRHKGTQQRIYARLFWAEANRLMVEPTIWSEEGAMKMLLYSTLGWDHLVSIDDPRTKLAIVDAVCTAMKDVSTERFAQWFPAEKIFDGDKWGMKDYFSSMEAIAEQGEAIKNFDELAWGYMNDITHQFIMNMMLTTSDMCKFTGRETPMESFMRDRGVTPLYYNEQEGCMYDPVTQKTHKVKPGKRKPKWIKVVK